MQRNRYIAELRAASNQPLSLDILLGPFGLTIDNEPDDSLLIGHLLDEIQDSVSEDGQVGVLDICTLALDLGHERAKTVLIGAIAAGPTSFSGF